MMHLSRITYRRNRNLGNYESAHAEFTLELGPEDDPAQALDVLRDLVHTQLGLHPDDTLVDLGEEDRTLERLRP